MTRRELHTRRRETVASLQDWLCAACPRSLIPLVFDLWHGHAYCRSCRLKSDAPTRIAKGLETRRLLRAQLGLFAKTESKAVEKAKRRRGSSSAALGGRNDMRRGLSAT